MDGPFFLNLRGLESSLPRSVPSCARRSRVPIYLGLSTGVGSSIVKLLGSPRAGVGLLVCCLFGALQDVRVARAGEPQLAADDAIVLCRGVSPTLRNVEHWRVGTKGSGCR